MLTISSVAAAKGVRNKQGKSVNRVHKTVYVETKKVETPLGAVDLKLFARNGQLGLGELNHSGEIEFVPLERVRIHRARSKAGTYRWYTDHRLTDEYGGGTVTVRLHGTDDDAIRKFNRAENLRPIPPHDPDLDLDLDRLYARRNDAESINRHLDDTLWLGRAHSIGRHRQSLNLLTYALCVNGLALPTSIGDDGSPPPPEALTRRPAPSPARARPTGRDWQNQPRIGVGTRPLERYASVLSSGLRGPGGYSPTFSAGPAQIAQSVEQRTRNA